MKEINSAVILKTFEHEGYIIEIVQEKDTYSSYIYKRNSWIRNLNSITEYLNHNARP